MNILNYYGGELIHYLAEQFVRLHHTANDGYSVYSQQGQPLVGFVPADQSKPIHKLTWVKD